MQIVKLTVRTMFGVPTCGIKIIKNTLGQKLSKRPMECREGGKAGRIFALQPWDIMAHT